MAEVQLKEVDKIYEGDVHAVQDLSLDVADGEFLVLVGPSGCGKTTALRMVAGLESITDGTITIGDRVVNDLSPKDRDIAMVFQNYALYPHLSVADNIAFGLRLRKMPKDVVDERIAWAAKLLDLTPYLARKPKELSGGQRQRVAMGRAIVREPQVFLMDEPLSNLDAKLRVQMRAEIAKLQHELGTTTIYVTHDQVEAMTMGDRVAVMSMGVLQQVDRPQHLYDEPASLFVASFIGTPPMNLFRGTVRHATTAPSSVTLGATTLAGRAVVRRALRRDPCARAAATSCVGIRAEDVHPASARPDLPTIDARVELVEALGSGVDGALPRSTWTSYRPIEARRRRRRRRSDAEASAGARDDAARTSSRTSRRGSTCGSPTRSRSRSTRQRSTSSTRRRVRRSRRAPIAARSLRGRARCSPASRRRSSRVRDAAAALGRCARGAREAADVHARSRRSAIYFVMPDRYANGDPSNDRGGAHRRRARVTGYDPADTGLVPRRRPEGAHRDVHGHAHGPRADQGPRLHRDLGHAGRRRSSTCRPTARPTTATGVSTSRTSTRTSARTPTSRRSSTARTGSG